MVMPWLFALLIVLFVVGAVAGWWLARKRTASGVGVAHTTRAREHPRFRRRLHLLRAGLVLVLAGAFTAGVASAYVAARPSETLTLESKMATRDIVLCLDVSGSMTDFDAELLEAFARVAENFEGERIGLFLWNSGTRTVFPLASDYNVVQSELERAARAFGAIRYNDDFFELISGTDAGGAFGSSLIGDGLASCTRGFDLEDEERSRSIIFATDNSLAGNPVFTLEEAAELAAEKGIVVHGLEAGLSYGWGSSEMQTALENHGMHYYQADDPGAAERIVEEIQSRDAVELGTMGDSVTLDNPGSWPVVIAAAFLVLLAIAWRFRL
ncbi:VWA domain-containing protein [Trueperella bialowiezensis]|uniref:VWFA domain-containing protein n=1 Tax=Trueperella bialowiezensis TaxID=312285 RepID=A0A3S4VGA7_9ACTO|nr:VWA domain-containing protein [Trueperella bialowiezensis]VEI13493.1 Uncharacterised protein [Trueperella bialowiezensis]